MRSIYHAMSPTRRRFLAGALVGIAALGTGCVGSSSSGGEPTPTPKNETSRPATTTNEAIPTTTVTTTTGTSLAHTSAKQTQATDSAASVPVIEPPACNGSLHRLSTQFDRIRYNSFGGFSLTVSGKTTMLGGPITFRLENEATGKRTTGNSEQFDMQHRTGGRWQSIYWIAAGAGYTGEGIPHRPGEGFTWRFTLTRNGLEHATRFNTPYSVCEDIAPGEYRFVYWAVSSREERESDFENEYAIGVRFTIERP